MDATVTNEGSPNANVPSVEELKLKEELHNIGAEAVEMATWPRKRIAEALEIREANRFAPHLADANLPYGREERERVIFDGLLHRAQCDDIDFAERHENVTRALAGADMAEARKRGEIVNSELSGSELDNRFDFFLEKHEHALRAAGIAFGRDHLRQTGMTGSLFKHQGRSAGERQPLPSPSAYDLEAIGEQIRAYQRDGQFTHLDVTRHDEVGRAARDAFVNLPAAHIVAGGTTFADQAQETRLAGAIHAFSSGERQIDPVDLTNGAANHLYGITVGRETERLFGWDRAAGSTGVSGIAALVERIEELQPVREHARIMAGIVNDPENPVPDYRWEQVRIKVAETMAVPGDRLHLRATASKEFKDALGTDELTVRDTWVSNDRSASGYLVHHSFEGSDALVPASMTEDIRGEEALIGLLVERAGRTWAVPINSEISGEAREIVGIEGRGASRTMPDGLRNLGRRLNELPVVGTFGLVNAKAGDHKGSALLKNPSLGGPTGEFLTEVVYRTVDAAIAKEDQATAKMDTARAAAMAAKSRERLLQY